MVEDWVGLIEIDGLAKLGIGVGIVLELVVDHSFGIVDWREGGVNFDKLIKEVHSLVEFVLPVVEQPNVVEPIDVCRIYLKGTQVVLLLLGNVA